MQPCNPARLAFSLIELLITIALLAVISTMMYGFSSRNYQREQQKRCQNNLQKIYIALQIYANEYHGKYPVVPDARTSEQALDILVPRYTTDTTAFVCPGSKNDSIPFGESFLKRRISYAYFMGRRVSETQEPLMSDRLVDTLPKVAGQAAFSTDGKPPGNNHYKYGGNFLFSDGRTELSPPELPFTLLLRQDVVILNPKP